MAAALTYQAIATAHDARQFPPPGKLVDIGGYHLHINTTGEGGPTVILDAGLGDCSINWCLVQPEVAKFARVCSYDRAGTGWSEPSPFPRTNRQIVQELHTLLTNAGIPGPYVLVGHSFGGLNVRLFAHEYPQEVAGLVLVDSSHEDQFARMPESMLKMMYDHLPELKSRRIWSRLGILRLFYPPTNRRLPVAMQAVDRSCRLRTTYWEACYGESITFEDCVTQFREAKTLPQVPLVVLTAGDMGNNPPPTISAEDFARWKALWVECQNELASRCADSTHITVEKSSHLIPLDQPAAVVAAIREVVEKARQRAAALAAAK
ncbi:MAG TPA: alpha/beta hydrolase [Opitutaceae bacterium]|nr:alpha/beta hydrolase [Opitutaceae bacterium]